MRQEEEIGSSAVFFLRWEATDNTLSWGCFATPTFHGVRSAATTVQKAREAHGPTEANLARAF